MHHAAIPHTRLSSHPLACNRSKKSSKKESKNNPIADGHDIAPQAASGGDSLTAMVRARTRPPQQVTPPRNRPLSPGAAAFTLQT